jgi:hypothetical protein
MLILGIYSSGFVCCGRCKVDYDSESGFYCLPRHLAADLAGAFRDHLTIHASLQHFDASESPAFRPEFIVCTRM